MCSRYAVITEKKCSCKKVSPEKTFLAFINRKIDRKFFKVIKKTGKLKISLI